MSVDLIHELNNNLSFSSTFGQITLCLKGNFLSELLPRWWFEIQLQELGFLWKCLLCSLESSLFKDVLLRKIFLLRIKGQLLEGGLGLRWYWQRVGSLLRRGLLSFFHDVLIFPSCLEFDFVYNRFYSLLLVELRQCLLFFSQPGPLLREKSLLMFPTDLRSYWPELGCIWQIPFIKWNSVRDLFRGPRAHISLEEDVVLFGNPQAFDKALWSKFYQRWCYLGLDSFLLIFS